MGIFSKQPKPSMQVKAEVAMRQVWNKETGRHHDVIWRLYEDGRLELASIRIINDDGSQQPDKNTGKFFSQLGFAALKSGANATREELIDLLEQRGWELIN